MSKKKNSMALYEVIAQSKDRRAPIDTQPPQWAERSAQQPPKLKPEASRPADSPPPMPKATPAPAPTSQAPAAATQAKPAEAFCVTLGMTGLALAGAGAVLLLAAGIWIGRATSGPDQAEAPTQADGQQAQLGHQAGVGGTGQTNPGAATTRDPNSYYLIIQDMLGSSPRQLEEAHKIVAYLKTKNVAATVEGPTNGRYLVVSMRPFAERHGPENTEYAQFIEAIGKEYKGPYDFRQRVNPSAPLTPAYVMFKPRQ